MKKRQWVFTIIMALVVAAVSYAASSAVFSRQAAGGCGPGMTPVVGYLELTPDQQNSVGPIDRQFRLQQQEACGELQDARARLLDVLRQPNTSQSDLNAALADVSSAQGKVQRQVAEFLLDMKPVLTDAQKDKLFSLVGQRFCGQGRCGAGVCPANGGGPGRRGRCGRM